MKYLTIFIFFISIHSMAQITGNPNVEDANAVKLDAEVVNRITGKWKLIKTVDYLKYEEQEWDRGIIVDFDQEGSIVSSWCDGCHQEKTGEWKIINEQSIKFYSIQPDVSTFLAGDWVVYKLTNDEMILAKVLTSSGDWKKFQYFSRDVSNKPLTEVTSYCINCNSEGSYCFGDKPEEAKRQWVMVSFLVKNNENNINDSSDILERYDWLLKNAPCIDKFLYVNAVKYYEKLLKDEENNQLIASYNEKIKLIKKQQQLYFKN